MNIIAISGKAEAGKTFTANILKDIYTQKGFSVKIYPLAEVLKEQAKDLGWNGEKDEKGRTFLQNLGKTVKAYNGMGYYAEKTLEKIKNENMDIAIIDDLRLPEEVEVLGDIITIRVERNGHENKLTEEQRKDISEVGLDNFIFDYTIWNTGDEMFIEIIKDLEKEGII